MRLVRFGEVGYEEPGVVLEDGRVMDASAVVRDYDEGFFACGGLESLAQWIEDGCVGGVLVDEGMRRGAPVKRPSKIICVGKNYMDHVAEFDHLVPEEPVLFMKATSAYCSPHEDVRIPKGSEKLDYEVELAVVIGRTASYVQQKDAREYIAGYSVICDYSERSFQKERSGQWVKGKSADTFAPMGPCMVTKDEVPNPNALRLWCKVNGELRQNGWTGDMRFSVDSLVSYISGFMTLLPGDVIATGTPGGVGMGFKPPRYLQVGNSVEFGIEGIGENRQRVVAF
ncbi:fumarylacetoacetate hydrolase family protein [Rubritalea spongiae]|uniref:Fumarylacetoacetate hydrolase family protein n=1 Tax=Rubritalea spongiae TaxID=430797 RepID=A0ABW5E238_9BACT